MADKLHHLVALIDSWRHNYADKNKVGGIVFRNDKLLSNVFWNSKSWDAIHKHPKGAEQLPETIEHPSEVWSLWADHETQKVVLRNYIKGNYVVQTEDGKIINAFLTTDINRYRKGCIILV